MYQINIDKLEIYAYHGVFDDEKENGQTFYVSAVLNLDTSAPTSDNLDESVNYADVCELINNVMTKKSYDLIETCADTVATSIITTYPIISEVSVTVFKPDAPVDMIFKNISVTTSKKWHRAYLSIGSNLGDTKKHLDTALSMITESSYNKNVRCSSYITTKPYGYTDQPDFLNAAIEVDTIFSPLELLDFISNIEQCEKRVRDIHWGPRTLDIDIILYDDIIMHTDKLIIPHKEMHKREFVLRPLCELNPYAMNPVLNQATCTLLNALDV